MEDKDYKDSERELTILYHKAIELYEYINIDALKNELKKLEEETLKDDFWKKNERVTYVNKNISKLKRRIEPWDKLCREISDDKDFMEMAFSESDIELLKEISGRINDHKKKFDELETFELLSGEDDNNNTFLIIHPGAGGTESQDWALMLHRMYLRWAEENKFEVDEINYSPSEEAGIKDATLLIKGNYAYGLLKSERGVHRLVRISPFDSNKRRHTSFASVEVIPELPENIDIEINETDLRIDTFRASGAGGQHVNKTDSAVRITHLPTGIVVQCQNERSQHNNRSYAMKVLKSRLYNLKKKELDEKKIGKLGEKKEISWGNQIRSYIFHPYSLVKDHRTGEETGNVDAILNGYINKFIYAYLHNIKRNQ